MWIQIRFFFSPTLLLWFRQAPCGLFFFTIIDQNHSQELKFDCLAYVFKYPCPHYAQHVNLSGTLLQEVETVNVKQDRKRDRARILIVIAKLTRVNIRAVVTQSLNDHRES